MSFVGNLSAFATAEEFCKSTKNWHSYSHSLCGSLFWLTV